ncbi:stage V sporulation protein S [Bacillus sp. MUM 116]|uniref:lasso peptide biosynthesis B2 protein n=1 Tax=Bacillus sp. MUM 116 TaxID=1678002 RepID=UPI0008F58276|nr:lasso peptide biosynthesis B2 protein [Bacillus sp. MUM 116]OIK09384.1 stage V sporulation protein S [Bacillus sp. MUM 116]
MGFVRNLRLFLTLDGKSIMMILEAYILLGWARIQKLKDFSKVSPLLGEKLSETTFTFNADDHKIAKKISQSIHLISKYTFWESQCLVKAMAAMKMLEKRKVESTLYLGTAKDEDGKLIAHAWLRTGPYFVTGSEGMEKFTVVATFAKRLSKNRGEKHAKEL